jgi:serine protease Do
MKKIKYSTFLIISIFLLISPLAAKTPPGSVSMIPASFSDLAEKAKPGVVNIQTVKTIEGGGRVYRHFFGQPFGQNKDFDDFFAPFFNQRPQSRKESSLGSGFIISNDGYIVTNNHVIKDADKVKVILHDNKEFEAKVIGTDPMTDLALVKIKADNLKPLKFGSSADAKVGSWVVAIGSPFGLEQTVTAGIVSAKGRIIGSGPYDDFIQTDASINPGNSGGPLLNMNGEVVGINTAIIRSGQGIGFAIPSDMAVGIIDQLTEQKHVSRGWLGVGIQDVTEELAEYYGIKETKGVYIAKVYEDNPAYDAGIKVGDVIIKINSKIIETSRDLSLTIASHSVGETVKVKVIRDGSKKTIKVKLGERPDENSTDFGQVQPYGPFGMRLKSITPEIAKRYGYPLGAKGLVVMEIKPGTPAASSPVRHGDLLIELNRRPIDSKRDYKAILKQLDTGDIAQLLFRRGNRVFVTQFSKP